MVFFVHTIKLFIGVVINYFEFLYLYAMKKIVLFLSFASVSLLNAQFKVIIDAPANFTPKEVYLYTLNGSKDILNTKEMRSGNSWKIDVKQPYTGMMKLYFPEDNTSINFISENKEVVMKFNVEGGKVNKVTYLDPANEMMNSIQDVQQKKEFILPALYQMKEYYRDGGAFGKALDVEITRLSDAKNDISKYPFVNFYHTNYSKFLEKSAGKTAPTQEQIIDFLTKSNDMLETSSLLRPVLVAYLNAGSSANISQGVDKLLEAVNTETPRGQTVLSELIEIFDIYGMSELKEKYLSNAKSLKCTINDRLAQTIELNKNTEIGATFADQVFNNATHTTAKSLHAVKADKKIVVFWASTCSHCEAELPKIIEKYNAIKKQGGEVIAFSLDSDKAAYENKAKNLPWINDTELRGWYSTYSEKYNVRATPSYFVLDANNKIIAKPDHAADLISFLKLN